MLLQASQTGFAQCFHRYPHPTAPSKPLKTENFVKFRPNWKVWARRSSRLSRTYCKHNAAGCPWSASSLLSGLVVQPHHFYWPSTVFDDSSQAKNQGRSCFSAPALCCLFGAPGFESSRLVCHFICFSSWKNSLLDALHRQLSRRRCDLRRSKLKSIK